MDVLESNPVRRRTPARRIAREQISETQCCRFRCFGNTDATKDRHHSTSSSIGGSLTVAKDGFCSSGRLALNFV
jgi:hypothetical protein